MAVRLNATSATTGARACLKFIGRLQMYAGPFRHPYPTVEHLIWSGAATPSAVASTMPQEAGRFPSLFLRLGSTLRPVRPCERTLPLSRAARRLQTGSRHEQEPVDCLRVGVAGVEPYAWPCPEYARVRTGFRLTTSHTPRTEPFAVRLRPPGYDVTSAIWLGGPPSPSGLRRDIRHLAWRSAFAATRLRRTAFAGSPAVACARR
jgi:hypothetical protein